MLMPMTQASHRRFLLIASFLLMSAAFFPRPLAAQDATGSRVVVTGADVPSAYGAPAAFSQSRFAPLTNAYVLPAGEFYSSIIYEGDAVHYRKPDHTFTQEVEVGLPGRFNLALENGVELFGGRGQDASFSFEARYAFAEWDKILLNPTIFAEYKVGIGHILHDEGAPTPGDKFGPGGFDQSANIPDAYEIRMLFS